MLLATLNFWPFSIKNFTSPLGQIWAKNPFLDERKIRPNWRSKIRAFRP